jgi:hypothetical protein
LTGTVDWSQYGSASRKLSLSAAGAFMAAAASAAMSAAWMVETRLATMRLAAGSGHCT